MLEEQANNPDLISRLLPEGFPSDKVEKEEQSEELIVPELPKKEVKVIVLKPFDELFAQEYAKTGNGTQSYAKAHDIDISQPLNYARARTLGSRALTRVDVCARINQILTLDDFNDESVDVQLNHLVHQHADKKIKLGAIKTYYERKGLIGNKSNLFTGNTLNLTQILRQANAPE